ncbi:TPA: ABC transporter ATP-binding protein [Streptococcus pyogenes]|uniref:ABC transporter ATP-binding protein n=1 Tax=Streptococcus anginosus group TaxID=671232 RepID=UPI0018998CDE|nr:MULTISPECIES: ABC transporter ATP-binding protein [Streptococcus anginosus group]HES1563205.1 ABC transporter ATP-binding protein [Streptococcus pyogenes]HEW2231192.1 ABC transporter ATP-binding protein [Streptococcus pneumoniae]MDB8662063.1 ABC transporter ATP-binding protein [Streptococcus anginosus]QQC23074.1 ABC transporter ATP-binding protein [Streptococcus constellatus]HEX1861176.1 ABC transporter ATP-binding protein [Streptococcus pneumoniae]
MEYSIVATELKKDYGEFNLNVSVKVPKGNIVGLIGENGAGKSTFLKLILGLIESNGGSFEILNEKKINENRMILENIGVVIDDNVIPENLNIIQVNRIMNDIYEQWDEEKFYRLTEELKLNKDKKIKEYSKGMKMKLSLMVALSHNPELLILDEPTTGLDPVVREQILDMFLDFVQDSSHSILFSSHIMDDLEKIADYIVFLKNGRVLLSEKKDNIIYEWGVLRCEEEKLKNIEEKYIIAYRASSYGYDVLVNDKETIKEIFEEVIIDDATLNETMLICSDNSRR